MPHRTSSIRNDYEQKINYDWPYLENSETSSYWYKKSFAI